MQDNLERDKGTQADDPDSDDDGLGDMVELQMKTDPNSPADDTSDLDLARQRLGDRRFAAQNQKSANADDSETSDDVVAEVAGASYGMDTLAADVAPAPEIASYEEPPYEETSHEERAYADTSSDDMNGDAWA